MARSDPKSSPTKWRTKVALTIDQMAKLYALKRSTGEPISTLIRRAVVEYLKGKRS